MSIYEGLTLGLGIIAMVGAIVGYGIAQSEKRDKRFEETITKLTTAMNAGIDKLADKIEGSMQKISEIQRDYVTHDVCGRRMDKMEHKIEKLEDVK